MAKGGLPESGFPRKNPLSSQKRYQRASTSFGS
jgi:hypothetical protein